MTETAGSDIFDLSPIPMWIEDFSGVKTQFDRWRAAGVRDFYSFLKQDRSRVSACSAKIRVIRVNRKTLELYEARDLSHLTAHLDRVFRDDMLEHHLIELAALWRGQTDFTGNSVNYTLSGRRLDIKLRCAVMPGYEETLGRILVTTEDVTEQERARCAERDSRRYAEGIFEHSPVSLWIEDFSPIRALIQQLRDQGVNDFAGFMDEHPDFVRRCMAEARVIDINKTTLALFGAPDRTTLLEHLPVIFRDEMEKPFKKQLLDLWDGRLFHHCEVVNYTLSGLKRHILRNFSVFPGYESDWSRVQIAMTDITERKEAEAHLEYLSTHDVLTSLRNRAFYTDALNRLEHQTIRPVSAILIDLNGLKEANDQAGHDAGDRLLKRLGEILGQVIEPPCQAARIGGDEFAILMPGADDTAAMALVDTIRSRLALSNQRYQNELPLSLSIGIATSEAGESMEALMKRADTHMYEQKRAFYTQERIRIQDSSPQI